MIGSTEAVTNMEDALQLAGGFGRFQFFSCFILGLAFNVQIYAFDSLPFLELFPVYQC